MKNEAGYYPGPVAPSTTDGAQLSQRPLPMTKKFIIWYFQS